MNVSRPGAQLQFIYFSLSIISPFLVAISTESLGAIHLYGPNLGHTLVLPFLLCNSMFVHLYGLKCIALYQWLYCGIWKFYNTLVSEMANLILRINEKKTILFWAIFIPSIFFSIFIHSMKTSHMKLFKYRATACIFINNN